MCCVDQLRSLPIADIIGSGRATNQKNDLSETLYEFIDSDNRENRMYKDKEIPKGVIERLFFNQ